MSRGYSVETRQPLWEILDLLNRRVGTDREDDPYGLVRRLRIVQLAEADDLGARFLDPVTAGDAEVEQALGDVGRDLLRSEDVNLLDTRVVDRRPVVDLRSPADRKIGRGEQLEGCLLERPLGKNEAKHRLAPRRRQRSLLRGPARRRTPSLPEHPSRRSTFAISTAVAAASLPLFPRAPPARARACSRFSVVRTPNTTGRDISSWTRWRPEAHSPATKS